MTWLATAGSGGRTVGKLVSGAIFEVPVSGVVAADSSVVLTGETTQVDSRAHAWQRGRESNPEQTRPEPHPLAQSRYCWQTHRAGRVAASDFSHDVGQYPSTARNDRSSPSRSVLSYELRSRKDFASSINLADQESATAEVPPGRKAARSWVPCVAVAAERASGLPVSGATSASKAARRLPTLAARCRSRCRRSARRGRQIRSRRRPPMRRVPLTAGARTGR